MRSLMMSLNGLARISTRNKILEAGCGPGLTSKLLALDMPKNGVAYCVDLSPKMLEKAISNFEMNEDFNSNKNNHWEYVDSSKFVEKIFVDRDVENLKKTKNGKIIKFMEGNGERLPFADNQFDCVISSLVLMLTSSAENMLRESFRVLENNGVAAFSIFGNKNLSHNFINIFFQNFEKNKIVPTEQRLPWHLAENMETLVELFKNCGFKSVKYAYTNVLWDVYTTQDFFTKIKLAFVEEALKDVSTEKKIEFFENITPIIEKEVINSNKLPTLNSVIILGFKQE